MSTTGAGGLRECVNTELHELEFKRGFVKGAVSRAACPLTRVFALVAQRPSTVIKLLMQNFNSPLILSWSYQDLDNGILTRLPECKVTPLHSRYFLARMYFGSSRLKQHPGPAVASESGIQLGFSPLKISR